MRTSRAGFTLVEILTVIAIIVILAAVLLPVLGRASEQSNRTHCLSNLHQIATAIKLYKLDERGYPYDLQEVVVASPSPRPWIPGERWFGSGTDADGDGLVDTPDRRNSGYGLATLYPHYIENIRVFNCPNNDTDVLKDTEMADPPDPPITEAQAEALTRWSFQSYDGWDTALNQLKYDRYWRNEPADGDPPDRHYIRQLRWRYPPEDTVLTWCTYHRAVIDPTDPQIENLRKTDRDLVVYLDGTTRVVPSWSEIAEQGSGHLSTPGEQE